MSDETETPEAGAYQVLARKYRPGHFRDLIGQDAMVQTLSNAFEHDRIAHAFIMTGVRGVGKTTTARIIAKGLNCQAGERPTVDPCGVCDACIAISEGRHVDVQEMDAASNTGVDYIREINEAVRYRPADARYKVYIIDEVHMLTTASFNALLKTLEEPPPHVKFIMATTEIQKVPVTVLSRCQRFDLRRIEPEVMIDHLRGIATKESAKLSDEALALVTRAAEGSVRDALSLLDQAIAHGRETEIDATAVRDMLGLADRGRVIDLFEAIMRGDAAGALEELGQQYSDGADPGVVLRDLAELTHWISVLKVNPANADDPTVGTGERDRGRDLAGRLSMRVLTRSWQMLLKALEELSLAPNAMMAAEMAVIRLTHVSDLPPPEELVRKLTEGGTISVPSGGGGAPRGGGNSGGGGPAAQLAVHENPSPAPAAEPANAMQALATFATLADAMAVVKAADFKLWDDCESFLRLVRYKPGMIEFNPAPGAPQEMSGRLQNVLSVATGERWAILVSDERGDPTAKEVAKAETDAAKAEVKNHPLVAAALAIFEVPEQDVENLLTIKALTEPDAAPEYLAAVPEDDDIEIEGDLVDMDDPWDDPFGEDT